MSNSPTTSEIATDRDLWNEYVDPNNEDPGAFDRMTTAEKIEFVNDTWPEDAS
jgi:hypothetical protein